MSVERSSFRFEDYEVRGKGEGRTLEVLAVPFDSPTNVGPYVETFRRGAFSKTIQERPQKVKLYAAHEDRSLPLGAAQSLVERSAGLVGTFRVSETRAGDEALALVRDGALDSVSIGFVPIRSDWSKDRKSVERREVKLLEVSLVAFPAYEDAKVLALRDQHLPKTGMPLTLAIQIASSL